MDQPLVSIIMPAYNAEKFIDKAIESVQKQDYLNWELLICDDCSVDNTKCIIKEFQDRDKRVKLFTLEENSGAAIARNTVIKEAKGEFISFLDSDDLWKPQKLSKQIEFMISNKYDFTCTYYDKIDHADKDMNNLIMYKEVSGVKDLLKNCPGNSTVIYNQKKLGKFYISNLKKRNDYLMWFNVLSKANFIYCLKENLSSHRVVESGLSNNKRTLVKYHWIIYRNELNLNIFTSSYYCIYWIGKGIKRKIIK
ncbi:glycosyltransferase family 2 protein [Vagococcus fluvialis]|uniref:glycosyltransferase family 2 protein n=1 Tax=Vagococcus fluvialis TaxID=2738 RepID=UPI001432E4B3|nr:glycosyltransferase family 2 protein [Vagococcus fluvialis]NKC59758.1 glycosyltransferase family 2 protein [Vagococcus fluvialis]NKD50655.1 glycosyltransferase family 2 protein [Vagococcus fluvialis]